MTVSPLFCFQSLTSKLSGSHTRLTVVGKRTHARDNELLYTTSSQHHHDYLAMDSLRSTLVDYTTSLAPPLNTASTTSTQMRPRSKRRLRRSRGLKINSPRSPTASQQDTRAVQVSMDVDVAEGASVYPGQWLAVCAVPRISGIWS